jgi:hypothetical protein
MHDRSLPPTDRQEATVAEPQHQRIPAIVLKTPNGYFRRFRSRGGILESRLAAHARIFMPGAKAIAATIARLKRHGIAATAIEVNIVIGRVQK